MASLTYDLVLAGLAVGSAAALTGIGLIVTYRATGVLNLAHGAIAMVCAYVLRQLVVEWGWPLPAGALVTLLVVAPGIGLVLDRLVFRPLALAGAGPAQTLVASIGVFVLLVGAAALVWGGGARDDAPVLLGDDPWAQLAAAVALACMVGAVTRWTRFGRELRAVVDNRPLAVLSGIPADRVSAVGWAFGSFTAGLTGVLLAPYVRLDPYGMPLLVVEVIAVAVVARMRSLPVAVLTALALGVAQAQLTRLHPAGWAGELLQAVGANLFVVALLVAALVLPGVGDTDALPPPRAAPRVPVPVWLVTAVLLLLPLGFAGEDLSTAVQVPALAVILLSLVVVAGRGGQIALGQAAYAGLGALFTALLSAAGLPVPVALGAAVLCVAPLGLLTGWPAIRRHGLALALATLAVGVAVSRFVFAQPYATAGVTVDRPAGFSDDRAYYALELLVLAACLLLVAALRRGRTGRALAALRDHEPGAEAAGVPVAALKLLAFTLGAALAALGGALLSMSVRAFDPDAFDPVRGLLWFAAVLTLGADTLLTPLAAATLLVSLDAGTHAGVAVALIGLLAALTGRVPPLLPWLLRGPGAPASRGAAPGPGRGPGARRLARPGRTAPGRGPDVRAAPGTAGGRGPGPAAVRGTPGTAGSWSRPPPVEPAEPAGQAPPVGADGSTALATGAPPHPATGGSTASAAHTPRRSTPADASPTTRATPAPTAPPEQQTPPTHPDTDPTPDLPAESPTPGGGPKPGAERPTPRAEPADTPPPTPTPGRGAPSGPVSPAPVLPADATTHPPTPRPATAPTAEPAGGLPSRPGRRPAAAGGPTGHLSPTPPGPATPARTAQRPAAADGGTPPKGTMAGGQEAPPARLVAQHVRLVHPGGTVALDGIDLVVRGGCVTAVVGANGAGKSTLFDCLAGAARPTAGRVLLDGVDVTRKAAHVRQRLGVGRTFQQLAVFPSLSVEENVRVGGPGAEQALRLTGLAGAVRHRAAAGLPTGTLRRVELARALAGRPHTLLLDEPAAGLDTKEAEALARILAALAADGLAVLVVEHDPDLVAGIARTVHTMEAGRIVSGGDP
ncbi:ATP-binding cassette domain-containing protein [Streptomyces sp. NPDC048623]|uniref:ABC transporter permease subunit n=1 Tax=Streptomyces sp. NPDC048623 TaxID=3155761 RepID=UPI0034231E40